MLKKIIVVFALLYSFSVQSDQTENIIVNDAERLYKFNFVRFKEDKDNEFINAKNTSIHFNAIEKIGKPFSIAATTNEDPKRSTKCDILVSNNKGEYALSLEFKNNRGIESIIYPIEATDTTVKLMISLVESNIISSSEAVKINDNCSFSNSVINTTNFQWFGDIEIGKKTIIKIQDKESLLVTIEKAIK